MTFVHAPDFVSLSEMPFLRSLTTQKRRPNLLVACTGPSVDGAVAQLAAVCAPPTRIYKLPGTVDLPACGGGTILLDDVSALTRRQQLQLFDWMTVRPNVQIVSVTQAPLL